MLTKLYQAIEMTLFVSFFASFSYFGYVMLPRFVS